MPPSINTTQANAHFYNQQHVDPMHQTPPAVTATPNGRNANKINFPGSNPPGSPKRSGSPRVKDDLANKFKTAPDKAGAVDTAPAEALEEADVTTKADRKNLIADHEAMQKVLEEMLAGDPPPGRESAHAAVYAHLGKQLTPRASKVPGVKLTGFSHLRYFESVMPHNFSPVPEVEDALKKIIQDSLAHAKHPTDPAPSHVFDVNQFHEATAPTPDPNFPPPEVTDAIHGRDLTGQHAVGIRQSHGGMAELMSTISAQYKPLYSIDKNKDEDEDDEKDNGQKKRPVNPEWRDAAWLAALMQVHPKTLADQLTKKFEGHPDSEAITSEITAMRKLAEELQAPTQSAPDDDHEKQKLSAALTAIRMKSSKLTTALLSGKKTLDGKLLAACKEGHEHTRIAALMSELDAPCIVLRQSTAADSKPHEIVFHAADESDAKEAFGTDDTDKQTAFLKDKIASVPLVVMTDTGFGIRRPKAPVKPAHSTPSGMPGPHGTEPPFAGNNATNGAGASHQAQHTA